MFCAPSLFGITLRVACVLLFLTCKEGLRGALQKSATAAPLVSPDRQYQLDAAGERRTSQTN